ncbi:MAG: transporter associated domain-containing protein [Gemmatimonadaceae bacterium]
MSVLLVLLAGLAAAVAAVSVYADSALLSLDEEEPPSSPAVRDLLARRESVHRALAFGRILAQLGAGTATTVALLSSGWVPARYLIPVVVVAGVALVMLTEVAAREAGDATGSTGLDRVHHLVAAIETLCAPVVRFGIWGDRLLHAVLPPSRDDAIEEREDAVERFREVVAAEAEAGGGDRILVHGVFSLRDTRVDAIMVPRVDIIGIELTTPWSEVADRVRSARHARLVVFDGSLDEPVGVLYAKDLLAALVDDVEPASGWRALYIPPTKGVEAQLREFRTSRRHIAIVLDEFGGTAGLITLEDILELIIGDIQDEGDVERPDIERGAGGRLWLSAGVTLEALSELLGQDLTREDVSTVGGLVMEVLGRVPTAGESLILADHRVVIERVVRRRVERIYLEPLTAETAVEVA